MPRIVKNVLFILLLMSYDILFCNCVENDDLYSNREHFKSIVSNSNDITVAETNRNNRLEEGKKSSEAENSDTNVWSEEWFTLIPVDFESVLKHFQISNHLFVFTSIIAFNLCLMKIIIFVLRLSKKETELRDISCKAQRQLYYFEAEKVKLEKEVESEREKSQIMRERMQTTEHRAIYLENEFRNAKTERDQLQQKVIRLESELDLASEAGLELNKLVNDFLVSHKENVNMNVIVDELQQQITKQTEIVAKYELTAKQLEIENNEYKNKLEKMNNEIKRLESVLNETEHCLENVQLNNEELNVSKSELNSALNAIQEEYSGLQNKTENYIIRNDELLSDYQKFSEEIESLKKQMANKNLEIESLREILSKFKISEIEDENENKIDNESENSIDLCDYLVKLQMESKTVEVERNELSSKLEELRNECKQLSERMIYFEETNKAFKSERESALQEKMKAILELEVMTKYYKEKQLEFGKEIGVQQVQRIRKEEDASSLASELVSLEEENKSYRSKLKLMKSEIKEMESNYKSQINHLEKQVHENWILARNIERKWEESKAEAAVLRQTLTLSVKSSVDAFDGELSLMDDSVGSVEFVPAIPAPPPPPPLPPLPPLPFPLMPGMNLPFNGQNDPQMLWNKFLPSAGVGPDSQQIQSNSTLIQTNSETAHNTNVSFLSDNQSSYTPTYVPQHHWDSSSNRDTFSPSSQRSNGSSHSSYKLDTNPTAPQSHYSNPLMSRSSPFSDSMNSMVNSIENNTTNTTVSSPLLSSRAPPVLSNPIPSHWMQTHFDYSNTESNNGSDNGSNSSRPTSRSDTNNLNTSMV